MGLYLLICHSLLWAVSEGHPFPPPTPTLINEEHTPKKKKKGQKGIEVQLHKYGQDPSAPMLSCNFAEV